MSYDDNDLLTYAISLASGVFFGPFSYGLISYIIFLIFWEMVIYILSPRWSWKKRLTIIVVGLVGWIVSRIMFRTLY